MDTLTLLIPLDATAFSRQILAEVTRLFPPERADVHLLHAREPTLGAAGQRTHYRYGRGAAPAPLHTFDKDGLDPADRAASERLERDAERFRELGYRASATLAFGDPADEIARAVADENADVVAMTTHARSGLALLVGGSVAQAVLARVRVPVVLLRGEA